MLTGDNVATANAVAKGPDVDKVRADLMPEDKVAAITELPAQAHCVAMIGDGINDAPALARADVGIAMGGGGTQDALEAADITLMTDDLAKIAGARAIARRADRTVQENLFVGVGVWCTCSASRPRYSAGSTPFRRRSFIWGRTCWCSSIRSSSFGFESRVCDAPAHAFDGTPLSMTFSTLPAVRGGLLARLAAALFGVSRPLVGHFGLGLGPFTTAGLLYAGAAVVGAMLRQPVE